VTDVNEHSALYLLFSVSVSPITTNMLSTCNLTHSLFVYVLNVTKNNVQSSQIAGSLCRFFFGVFLLATDVVVFLI